MKFLRSRRGMAVVAAGMLLILFLVRPGANRLRTRIVGSISLALGRPVEVSGVKLRLLPRPGFDLESFVVHEDPAFGAEPVLRAQEVTASLRLLSLLRGRIEIAQLNLDSPSLNLVQNSTGHWNLETFLERAARTPVAPTAKSPTESRPGFPYIEADGGRINVKIGAEKRPYALTEADFSVWQDSENVWGMRLRARPVRTDSNLSDTGMLRMNGNWQRAASLRETPVRFSLQWDRAQLGQVTKLIYGSDQGWRGQVSVSASLTGFPAELAVSANLSIDGFRRYDLPDGDPLRLAAQCTGQYSSVTRSLPKLSCRAPMDGGFVALEGSLAGPASSPAYDLALTAQDVPMQSLVALARHSKKDIPDDLDVAGKVNAAFSLDSTQGQREWEGKGEAQGLRLAGKAKADVLPERIPFEASSSDPGPSGESRVVFGPINLALGRPAPAVVRAWVSRSGYSVQLRGEAQLQRLLHLARTVGVPTVQSGADGVAKVDLQIAGGWSAFAALQTLGKAQLHGVHADVRGLSKPIEIASADVVLSSSDTRVNNIVASAGGGTWRGSLAMARQCGTPGACVVHFDLNADQLVVNELGQASTATPGWLKMLSSSTQPTSPFLLNLRAAGHLNVKSVTAGRFHGSHFSADADLEKGKLRLSNLNGEFLGGVHSGALTADLSVQPPQYDGEGNIEGVDLKKLAETMRADWVTGDADFGYKISTSGATRADLMSSATGELEVEAANATLPRVEMSPGAGPLQVRRFTGKMHLRDGRLEFQDARLETPAAIYQVTGTASDNQTINVKLTRSGARGYNITGTLVDPKVVESTSIQTEASLKP